jgi:hypothetical protein
MGEIPFPAEIGGTVALYESPYPPSSGGAEDFGEV